MIESRIYVTRAANDRITFCGGYSGTRYSGTNRSGMIVYGDVCRTIEPGESAFGKTFAEWMASDVEDFELNKNGNANENGPTGM